MKLHRGKHSSGKIKIFKGMLLGKKSFGSFSSSHSFFFNNCKAHSQQKREFHFEKKDENQILNVPFYTSYN